MTTERHSHPIDATVSAAPPGHGHTHGNPHAYRSSEPDAEKAPPVQAPAESAAEQYRAIAEVTADWAYALHIAADDRAITDWMSSNVQQVTGFTAAELGSTDAWLRMVHRDDRELMRSHLRSLQAGRASTAEYRVVTKSGETRWVRDYARPMSHPRHGIVQVVGGIRDITARKQAEMDRARLLTECELLAEQKQRLVAEIDSVLRKLSAELRDSAESLEPLSSRPSPDAERLQTHIARFRRIAGELTGMLERVEEFSAEQ
ncbi:MAG: PAS domain-containing protein [Gemmatimonadota bacterium]